MAAAGPTYPVDREDCARRIDARYERTGAPAKQYEMYRFDIGVDIQSMSDVTFLF